MAVSRPRVLVRALVTAALVVAVGVVASPGPAAAASQSCATINGVMDNNYNIFRDPLASGTIVDTSTLSIVSGTYVPLATSRSYVLSCGTLATPEMPRLGERFYVLMDTYMRYQTLSSNVVHTFRLPTGLYPAVDANNPVVCWTTNGSVVTPKSCSAAVDTGLNSPGWGGAFSWYLNATTYQLVSPVTGDGPVIGAGLDYFTLMPVVATRPFSMASLSDRLWASAWIHFPGGAVNSYAFSDSSLRALDRNPELDYPTDAVSSLTTNSAALKGTVLNYWKGGTAWFQYGTTTSYGKQTATDAIPGNDPAQPGWYTSPLTASGLSPSTTYHYRVVFAVTGGATYYGADRTFTTPAGASTTPGAPTGVTATPGNASAQVSWNAPGSNGGSAITGYTVTSNPGAKTCTTTGGLSCAVGGLSNGTSYTFTVRATNGVGTGPASSASAAVVPRTTPGAPTGVAAQPGNASALVSWAAPASNGGSAITGYTVTSNPEAKTCTTTGALSCTVGGLSNGTSYTFTVRATNGVGTGPVSPASAAVTPKAVPTPPLSPTATAGNASATVKWGTPAGNGGSPITGYVATAAPGGRTCTTTGALQCVVTGLTNGVGYTFTVRAISAGGSSLPSAATAKVTPSTVPAKVRTLRAAFPRAKVTTVTWLAPASNGGAALVRYDVRWKKATVTRWSAWASTRLVRARTIAGLLKGVAYDVQVRAVNARGAGLPLALRFKPTK